ncbi:hypothetical protein U2T78_003241 [Providencia stuartii]|uniref:hypothetical protein n=1 Tax=Providencia stuartii TaxID=588 RepID=UPI002AB4EAA2|nr:hypothetical protein [Providencia stuartii]EMA3642473.1 hypothetical protein [Providencia stuartii]MEB3133935.1 hypothetical protein [Providencia stuartii]
MFRLSRNERSHWSGNGVHVEPESVFMIGRNMQVSANPQVDEPSPEGGRRAGCLGALKQNQEGPA